MGLLAVAATVPGLLVWAVPGLAAATTVSWLIARARAEKMRHRNADDVVQACQALAAQLRIGDIPAQALSRVALDTPLLVQVAATQAIGGDVPAALRSAAARPGCEGLAALARAWQLCQLTGAPVARAVGQVSEGMRAAAAAERLVASELASTRATGRMLAALPLLGIGLGFVGGGNPIEFLLGTAVGGACLAIAVCLVCAGLIWTTRLGQPPSGRQEG